MNPADDGALSSVYKLNEDFFNANGRNRIARVITFGCQMNDNDSEKIMGLLVSMGFEIERPPPAGKFGNPAPLGDLNAPDLIILNTCCVRENAESRFYGILGSLKRFKSEDGSRVLAVCGCMMQENNSVNNILQKYRYVDFIFGTKAISGLPRLLYDAYHKKRGARDIAVKNELTDSCPDESLPMFRKAPPLAYISVMSGCDNFCSYCVVPYVRGRERSRTPDSVVNEAEELAAGGYREITLLGQNVNSYGNDLPGGQCDFAELLRRLSEVKGISRIRFMTSHPKDLSDRLIEVVGDISAVCPHLHLPVQSGSTNVLERMNRGYSRGDYLALINKIRNKSPDIVLTTDLIVGFPGESEADFKDTLDLVYEVGFDLAYTFLYSPREGTAAAGYPDRIPDRVAKERFERLLKLQNGVSLKKNLGCVGKVFEVLCEGASKTNEKRYTGRTPGGKVVNFDYPLERAGINPAGELVRVRIDGAGTWSLSGTVII